MGKKPAASKPTSKGAASKGKAGKKQRGSGGYDALRDPLDRQLGLLGLRVKNITADGNCFFRALSDQLQGDEGRHSELRSGVCDLMGQQAESFAPFVEDDQDDQSLEGHLGRMRREGVWAGHMELQAASLLLESNIAIYQAGQPRWCIMNFPPGSRMLHLSYEDGQHYNSVRRADDYSRGCPADIPDTLTPIADAGQAQQCRSAADEKLVSEGTGCDNPVLIQQQLQRTGGDVDAAIEAVIEIMAGEEYVDAEGPVAADTTEAAAGADAAVAAVAGAAAEEEAGQAEGEGQGQHTGPTESVGSAAEGDARASLSSPAEQQPQPADDAAATTADAGPQQQQQHEQQQGQEEQQQQQGTPDPTAPGQLQQQQEEAQHAPCPPAAAVADGSSKASSKKAKGVRLKSGSSAVSSRRSAAAAADSKPPSRNKACPCGSGRKHKNCCGAGGHKTGAKQTAAAAAGMDALPAALGTLHI